LELYLKLSQEYGHYTCEHNGVFFISNRDIERVVLNPQRVFIAGTIDICSKRVSLLRHGQPVIELNEETGRLMVEPQSKLTNAL